MSNGRVLPVSKSINSSIFHLAPTRAYFPFVLEYCHILQLILCVPFFLQHEIGAHLRLLCASLNHLTSLCSASASGGYGGGNPIPILLVAMERMK